MKNSVSVFSMVLAVLAILFSAFVWYQQPKVGVVDNARLVSEFKATQEAHQQIKIRLDSRQFKVDSMEIKLESEYKQLMEKKDKLSPKNFEQEKQAFLRLKEEYSKMNAMYQNQNSSEEQERLAHVTAQLNAYVQAFGEEQGYDYILGANGTGNIWHIRKAFDITDQVIDYANKKYEGE